MMMIPEPWGNTPRWIERHQGKHSTLPTPHQILSSRMAPASIVFTDGRQRSVQLISPNSLRRIALLRDRQAAWSSLKLQIRCVADS
jgi:hypothetical protein